MADLAARFRAVAVDFGTGDGSFVQHAARCAPDQLVIGVDANAENLREAGRRAAAKPARGGLPNARFGVLALDQAPGALLQLADELTVILPWGTLLAAVATARPEALQRLAAVCKPGARIRILFGYGPSADATAITAHALPDSAAAAFGPQLASRYRAAGFALHARPVSVEEVRAVPSTWAKKLAFSGKPRSFWELTGTSHHPRKDRRG
jgi:16S rRNA (adenine(1408)-N(1))-methyltransferase